MDKQRAEKLLEKFRNDALTEEERAELESWYAHYGASQDALEDSDVFQNRLAEMDSAFTFKKPVMVKRLWPRIAAAASILIALAAGGYFILQKQQPTQQAARLFKNDIAPGHNQATLTLANGRKILLTKGLSGQLAVQNKTVISATQNTITYDANKSGDQISFNTLATAKGEQSPYPLILADGTKVWLNAESSITFPTAFNQKERIVKITGEAYFEVKHDQTHPFKVQTDKQTIEDIGTAFDVNAYMDEPATRTTLVEGSVKVNGMILKPNEQTDGTMIKTVNTETYTAWKNGKFHFDGQDIHTVMRQLSRWYNIDVDYQGTPSTEGFYAGISRNRNISAVLKLLQNTNGVEFKVEGRRVTVIEQK